MIDGQKNRREQFIKENGKVRFRLYKAGKNWLVAGTATVSGLLGGMFIMPHSVQAADQPQTGKVVDKGQVLATQNSATIPASSTQASTSASESTSTSASTSASQSSSTSASTSNSTSQSTSTDKSESASASSAASQSASSANSTSTSTANAVSTNAAVNKTKTANALTANKAQVAAPSNASVQATAAVKDTAQYNTGLSDAKNRFDNAWHYVFLGTSYNGLAKDLVIDITNLSGPGRAVDRLGKLYDYYKQTGGTMLDADGFSQAYTYFGLTTKSTDYAAGFAAYTADYMKGVIAWLETIKSKATDESNNGAVVNSIIDFKQYDANALSGGNFGSDISAFIKFVLNWIFGAGTYAPDVMNAYTPDSSNRAAAEIKSTITNANNIIAFVATQVIDGIAHMALSDIRSLGGADVVMNQNPLTGNPIADYVPDTLAQAIALNGSNYNMIKLFGLTNAINSSFMNLIYEGIAEVARHAIQYNFFDGMKMAIQNALDGNPVNGNTIYKDITGYDDNNPAAMMDSTSNNDLNLSYLSQASGYAWANKVLTPIIRMAAANALADAAPGSTSKQDNLDATTLISRLVTAKVITADEASQILQNTGHVFTQANQVDSSGNVIGKYSYVRAGAGAAKMFENIYQAEYAAVRNGVADYQANPAISASQIATNQAKITFQSPTDPRDPKNDNHYQDNSQIHNFNLNDYTNVIKYLQLMQVS